MGTWHLRDALLARLGQRKSLRVLRALKRMGGSNKSGLREIVDALLTDMAEIASDALSEGDTFTFPNVCTLVPEFRPEGKLSFSTTINRTLAETVRSEMSSRGLWGDGVSLGDLYRRPARESAIAPLASGVHDVVRAG